MSDSETPNTCSWQSQTDALTRREPTKAVVTAFSAGLVLSLLPTRTILRTLTTIALGLVRPALCCIGVQKLWALCPCKKKI